jgi:hypothetical protein
MPAGGGHPRRGEKEGIPVSTRDKAGNTAQAAKGQGHTAVGKAARDLYAQARGARKVTLKQAGEKLKGAGNEVTAGGKTMDVTQTLIAASAAGGGETVRPDAGNTGSLW